MALMDAILAPGKARGTKVTALATTTSSAEVSLGQNTVFAINSDQDCGIRFGTVGMGAATVADFRIPANVTQVWYMGDAFTHIRVFNHDGTATSDVYIMPMSRF